MGYRLHREVEMMMKLLDRGPWRLVLNKIFGKFRYQLIDYSQFARNIVVEGSGASKKEALENLLETWRSGKSELPCPARSREELELKLMLLGKKMSQGSQKFPHMQRGVRYASQRFLREFLRFFGF